ncbi:MAG: Uma2 family endonuclease [Candidatus Solibacter usitatus]|nr:Uma2 family endonuclease [Candidatus Solibacter usitatus]
MASPVLVSVGEYLATSYRPDCDYIDGELVERNMGEKDHSALQTELATWLNSRKRELGIRVFVEQRVRISASRFRIPDICVYAGRSPDEQVFTTPPLICIEILSACDTLRSFQQRVDDYLAFGVPYIWLVDPVSRRAWVCSDAGMIEEKTGTLSTTEPSIGLPFVEIMAALD